MAGGMTGVAFEKGVAPLIEIARNPCARHASCAISNKGATPFSKCLLCVAGGYPSWNINLKTDFGPILTSFDRPASRVDKNELANRGRSRDGK